jgi:hypothetical protein
MSEVGIVCGQAVQRHGLQDRCSYWSPPGGDELMQTPSSTICTAGTCSRHQDDHMISTMTICQSVITAQEGGKPVTRSVEAQVHAASTPSAMAAVQLPGLTLVHLPPQGLRAPVRAGWLTGTRQAWGWPVPHSRWPAPPQNIPQAHRHCTPQHSTAEHSMGAVRGGCRGAQATEQHAATAVAERAGHQGQHVSCCCLPTVLCWVGDATSSCQLQFTQVELHHVVVQHSRCRVPTCGHSATGIGYCR